MIHGRIKYHVALISPGQEDLIYNDCCLCSDQIWKVTVSPLCFYYLNSLPYSILSQLSRSISCRQVPRYLLIRKYPLKLLQLTATPYEQEGVIFTPRPLLLLAAMLAGLRLCYTHAKQYCRPGLGPVSSVLLQGKMELGESKLNLTNCVLN